jgi:hypothetical protein
MKPKPRPNMFYSKSIIDPQTNSLGLEMQMKMETAEAQRVAVSVRGGIPRYRQLLSCSSVYLSTKGKMQVLIE